jgi:uncharacterized protein YidB (DUF937 family)
MNTSFSGEYRACGSCFERMENMGAVETVQTWTHRENRTTVKAKTLETLQALRHNK